VEGEGIGYFANFVCFVVPSPLLAAGVLQVQFNNHLVFLVEGEGIGYFANFVCFVTPIPTARRRGRVQNDKTHFVLFVKGWDWLLRKLCLLRYAHPLCSPQGPLQEQTDNKLSTFCFLGSTFENEFSGTP
jgi:hypothetical protein